MTNITTNTTVEFAFILDDYTWHTEFIDIPEEICTGGTPSENENGAIDWVWNNVKLSDKVIMINVYSWGE